MYYASLKEAAFEEAERQAAIRIELIGKSFSSYLSENIKSVKALAGMDEMLEMLVRPSEAAQNNSNKMLDLFKASLDVDVCYLMDHEGNTVASSNRDAPDSFVGKNFAFRPYFQQAIHSAPSTYLALGTTSHKRGVYYSFPVFEKGEDLPIGLVVIKASIDQIEKKLNLSQDEILLITDPSGIIFISNRKDWLFHSIYALSPEEKEKIKASRQFGNGPWEWVGITFSGARQAEDTRGDQYLVHQSNIENYEGWRFIHLRNRKAVYDMVSDPIVRIMGPAVLILCAIVGMSIIFLYRKASHEIFRRKSAENALRKSEERYRSIYHMAPAMLHSVNSKGRLISVSENWLKALGYKHQEVIGQPLVNFLSKESAEYVKKTVMPEFFKTGVVSDIPYEFVKQNGEAIKALVSAIGERDEDGNVVRSLTVSIDVTERIRAQEDLKLAKEKLSHYSKDLERLVKKQTGEIKSILKYTPSVISIKNLEGRYVLVNSRFEELFDMPEETILGKTDHELFQKKLADQFRNNDLTVLKRKKASQMEEQIQQADGEHTYFSVKFPVYDDREDIIGVCGISTDISALKKAQNQLRRLSAGIMANQENERAAISRELHDELGQMLTALRMDSVWIAEYLKGSEKKVSERARSMCGLIDQTIEEVRSMAVRLRPGVLDHLGLVDALEWYTADFERRTEISCVFEHSNVPGINDVLSTAAYRIAQEALTNVARHADAKHVDVSLTRNDGHLVLSVADDGKGFDTGKLSESEGLGVAGIRERASLVGGEVNVFSEPNKGTRVFFSVPLNLGE
jgi:PAS domain S-box-containing protein